MVRDRRLWARKFGLEIRGGGKYGAEAVTINGVRFDSRREARRYQELAVLEAAGLITALERHPRFAIETIGIDGARVGCGAYTADFRYVDGVTGEVIVEDVKSPPTRTTAYRLRKRLVEAQYGITIVEV